MLDRPRLACRCTRQATGPKIRRGPQTISFAAPAKCLWRMGPSPPLLLGFCGPIRSARRSVARTRIGGRQEARNRASGDGIDAGPVVENRSVDDANRGTGAAADDAVYPVIGDHSLRDIDF